MACDFIFPVILNIDRGILCSHCTCGGDMRTAAHFQQFQGVAVVGHQHLQRGVIHWRVVNLQ